MVDGGVVYDQKGDNTWYTKYADMAEYAYNNNLKVVDWAQVETEYEITWYDPHPRVKIDVVVHEGIISYVGKFQNVRLSEWTHSVILYCPEIPRSEGIGILRGALVRAHSNVSHSKDGYITQVDIPLSLPRPVFVFFDEDHVFQAQFELIARFTRFSLSRTMKNYFKPSSSYTDHSLNRDKIMEVLDSKQDGEVVTSSQFYIQLGLTEAEVFEACWGSDHIVTLEDPKICWILGKKMTTRVGSSRAANIWAAWISRGEFIVPTEDAKEVGRFLASQGKPPRLYVPLSNALTRLQRSVEQYS